MSSICFPTLKNCYATSLSYGEICVGCNCCGAFNKDKRGLARLHYNQEQLYKNLNFKDWCDVPELRAIQEANVKRNIKYYRRQVRYYSKYRVMK